MPKEMFDPHYLKSLFELGRLRGRDDTAWQNTPPAVKEQELINHRYIFVSRVRPSRSLIKVGSSRKLKR